MSWWMRIYDRTDRTLTHWMAGNGVRLLRLSLGGVFLWFGVLKFFPGLSPAESLVEATVSALTFGWIDPRSALFVLAAWESLIGLGLIAGYFLRATLFLLWLQMLGTMTPLFLFPELCFTVVPLAPTIEGQYILKNLVLIAAGIVIGATVRGGRLAIADPGGRAGREADGAHDLGAHPADQADQSGR